MKEFSSDEDIDNKNLVKVVCNAKNDALYFSRSPIPYKRNAESSHPYYRHIGVYAFRKDTLLQFTQWPLGMLENAEMLEQLRYLENGISIRMIKTDMNTIGIDTAEDLEKARLYAKNINS
jgi:3-deoxy-manno-octulosonate cytidylyltransferase (CMP-KDO synthetase)